MREILDHNKRVCYVDDIKTPWECPENVSAIMRTLLTAGHEAYVVGGAVRDWLLGIPPHDYDIFTNATGEQILALFPHGKVMGGEERQAKILTVIVDGIEVSQYRANGKRTETGTDFKTHLSTCDFTINAMAMDIDGNLHDYHGGQYDLLHEKVVRFVGRAADRIEEDPLRILRGMRFHLKYDMPVFCDSAFFMITQKDAFDMLPPDRIRTEFLNLLVYPKSPEDLHEFELLLKILPEFAEVIGVEGGDMHNEPVHEHCFNAAMHMQSITGNGLLIFTALLHDIGKGRTKTFTPINMEWKCASVQPNPEVPGGVDITLDGHHEGLETHFYEHDKVGADMVQVIMERMNFSTADIKYVTTLVRLHMYGYKGEPSKKSYIRFFAKLQEAGIPIEDYIMLIYCDHQGNMRKPRIKFGDFIKGNWLYKKWQEITYSEEPLTVKDLKVGGKDVMEILDVRPSPSIGNILNALFEMVMAGDIKNTKEDLRRILKQNCGSVHDIIVEERNKKPRMAFDGIHMVNKDE